MSTLHFHQHYSLFHTPSSLYFASRPLYSTTQNGKLRKYDKRRSWGCPSCKLSKVSSQDVDWCYKRRAFLFLGISIFPVLPFMEDHTFASENEESSNKEDRKVKMDLNRSSANPILSLLNAIGVLSSGVLAALYSLVQKDKQTSTAMVDSLSSQLEEKKAAIVSLGKEFETKLSHKQDEHNKQLAKAKEEQLSLTNQLESVNSTISDLGRELHNEKKKMEELQIQIGNLNMQLGEAENEKLALEAELKDKGDFVATLHEKIDQLSSEIKEKDEAIQTLSSTSAQKDSDLGKLNSAYKEIKDKLNLMTSETVSLKAELVTNQNELIQRNMMIDDLNNMVSSLTTDRDHLTMKVKDVEHEYDDLKSAFDAKVVSNAQLLSEKEQAILELKVEYDRAVAEGNEKKTVISELTQEMENLKKLLDVEANNAKSVKQELKMATEALALSRNEFTDLNNRLNQSKKLCSELGSALSEAQTEFSRARESLQRSLSEAKHHSESLAGELISVKEELNESKSKYQIVSSDLDAMRENCGRLKKELIDVYKKTEETTNALEEEKKVVDSLKDDLVALEKQISKDREAMESLEAARKKAKRSLDEMQKNSGILSHDLGVSKTQISNLEEEIGFLKSALDKEKRDTQEARENLEDVQSLASKLASERQRLDKRVKKLEGDLASAKGEILRLRTKSAVVNSEPKQEATTVKSNANEVSGESAIDNGAVVTTPVKRGRRRKGSSQ